LSKDQPKIDKIVKPRLNKLIVPDIPPSTARGEHKPRTALFWLGLNPYRLSLNPYWIGLTPYWLGLSTYESKYLSIKLKNPKDKKTLKPETCNIPTNLTNGPIGEFRTIGGRSCTPPPGDGSHAHGGQKTHTF
jgi:hypothetical protein